MNGCGKLQFRLVPRVDLSPAEKDQMFGLLSSHFEGVERGQFARDLAEKNLALLLESNSRPVGFSTLMAYTTSFEGERINVIYSGDTIVAKEAWGTSALPRAWVAGVETLRSKLPPGRCFWLLLTSGFRTYRFLPVFWRIFYPRFDSPTPPASQQLLDELAISRFGSQFDSRSGVVHFTRPQRLRCDLKEVPPERERDPHIAFFLSRNPGHAEGDELVCLTELCFQNLTAAGRRIMSPRAYATDHANC
ncbi:MAG TPA: hypothetical protein VH595_03305 [Verrucomicrobiae bacterium]|jgi:hypothetical protein|nr:hypothetical protein [Verrucomicrobiae bacterium]